VDADCANVSGESKRSAVTWQVITY